MRGAGNVRGKGAAARRSDPEGRPSHQVLGEAAEVRPHRAPVERRWQRRQDSQGALPRLRELASRVAIPNVAAALAHTALIAGLSEVDDRTATDDVRVLELAAVPTVRPTPWCTCGVETSPRPAGSSSPPRAILDRPRRLHVDDALVLRRRARPRAGGRGDGEGVGRGPRAVLRPVVLDGPDRCRRPDRPLSRPRRRGVGDISRATRVADLAAEQCVAWAAPRAGERLAMYRSAHAF